MILFHLVSLAALLLIGGFILALLRNLRRTRIPDPAGEAVTAAIMLYAVAQTALSIAWPDRPDWVKIAAPVPALLAVAWFCIRRIRRNPEALFSPATIRRFRSLRRRR